MVAKHFKSGLKSQPLQMKSDFIEMALTGRYISSPVLGAIPERCLCRDLELDCDGGQLPDIPVVAINVTMM